MAAEVRVRINLVIYVNYSKRCRHISDYWNIRQLAWVDTFGKCIKPYFHIFVPGLFTYLYQNFSHICTRTYILYFHLYKRKKKKKKSFYFIIIRNCPSHAYFVFFCQSGFLLVQLFRYSVIFISIHSKTDIHFVLNTTFVTLQLVTC